MPHYTTQHNTANTNSFRTPEHVRAEWHKQHALPAFAPNSAFDTALDVVCARLAVNTAHSDNAHNTLLRTGAAAASMSAHTIPRNCAPRSPPAQNGSQKNSSQKNVAEQSAGGGCALDCGSCCHGCAYGAKRCTATTWLADAAATGRLTLLPNTEVQSITQAGGRATGVVGVRRAVDTDEGVLAADVRITVRARAVVCSAGALHTPALLLRSGLKNRSIGRYLALHPVLSTVGVFPGTDTELCKGVSMGGCYFSLVLLLFELYSSFSKLLLLHSVSSLCVMLRYHKGRVQYS
jgi:long-chain-alcohol oxidase